MAENEIQMETQKDTFAAIRCTSGFSSSFFLLTNMFMNCSWTCSKKITEFEFIQIFPTKIWTCSWTVHGQVQIIWTCSWTVHEGRPSAGAVWSTFFCGVSRNFFFGFCEHCHQGYLDDFRRKKQLIHQRHAHTTSWTKHSSSNIWGGTIGLSSWVYEYII